MYQVVRAIPLEPINQTADSPPVEDPAHGDDPLVDSRRGIEGEDDGVPPEPPQKIAQEVELEEVVEENEEKDERGREVVGRWRQGGGLKEESDGRGFLGDGGEVGRHGFRRSRKKKRGEESSDLTITLKWESHRRTAEAFYGTHEGSVLVVQCEVLDQLELTSAVGAHPVLRRVSGWRES
ncbi:hypothetical protein B296_00043593 [Ensete ventricosum]|uniref:Uncharacterized protein n=1 Tax=Ensete ventricosum TaxID=4639 RepID=A0A426Y2T0_ENSVE|nr:hypothetical protein B296_00043593 [Ensete ventricosum]